MVPSYTMRNPNWTRDEVILALDLYLKRREQGVTWDGRVPEVIELAQLLRELPIHPKEIRTEKFRTPSSISLKLSNLGSLDPNYPSGAVNASEMDREVWEEFGTDWGRLHKVAASIRKRYKELPDVESVGEQVAPYKAVSDEQPEWVEGRILTRMHLVRERDPRAAAEKKRVELERTGRLRCEPCSFDFFEIYGEHGRGYIECHHRIPLADLAESRTTRLEDLALVCANCHRMLHRGRRVLGVEELVILYREGRAGSSLH